MIYFIADTHFFHSNIIKYCRRPFADIEAMNNALIQNWNTTVRSDDEVYILGDFAFQKADKVHHLAKRLAGKKYLIRGNHDKFLKDYASYEDDFVWIKDYSELSACGRKFVLFHYPITEWAGYYHDAIHCYGHVHNGAVAQGTIEQLEKMEKKPYMLPGRSVNVGVDVTGFRPISIYEVIRIADQAAKAR